MKRIISVIIILTVLFCASCSKTEEKASDMFCLTLPDGSVICVGDNVSVLETSEFLRNSRTESSEVETCLEDGKEYYYGYDGLSVQTDSSKIVIIKITSSDYSTVSGVHVGMTAEELTELCGEGTNRGEFILYKKGSRSGMFYTEDGIIVSIVLR